MTHVKYVYSSKLNALAYVRRFVKIKRLIIAYNY